MYKAVIFVILAIIVQRLYFIFSSSNMTTLPSMVDKNTIDYGMYKSIFVTDAVNLGNIDKCPMDRFREFKHIKSSEFNITSMIRPNLIGEFLVYHPNHFVLYKAHDGSSAKFSYRSRNKVLSLLWRGIYLMKTLEEHGLVKNKDGVWHLEQVPVHYFIYTSDLNCLRPKIIWPEDRKMYRVEKPDAELLRPAVNLADDNTIVSYYDSVEKESFEEFAAEVTNKDAERCNQDFFVVNNKDLCHVVSVQDPQVSYSFAAKDRYKYIPKLIDGSVTVAELTNINDNGEVEESAGDFQLRNYDGQVLTEDHLFALQVLDLESDGIVYGFGDEEDSDDFDYFADPYDWFTIVEYGSDSELTETAGFANPHRPSFLKTKSVDGILYLVTPNGNYLGLGYRYCDRDEPTIFLYRDPPPKDMRLRINVSEDGQYFTLGMWDKKDRLAFLGWLKAACGWVYIDDPEGERFWGGSVMKLRAVRVD